MIALGKNENILRMTLIVLPGWWIRSDSFPEQYYINSNFYDSDHAIAVSNWSEAAINVDTTSA